MRCRWAALLPLAVLYAAAAYGQPAPRFGDGLSPAERPSHRPVGSGLETLLQPQELLERRLHGPRLTQAERETRDRAQLQGDFRALVQRLMRDPRFLDSIRNSLTPEDLERVRRQFENGEPLVEDGALQRLLEQAIGGKGLTATDAEALRRLAEKLRESGLLTRPMNHATGTPRTLGPTGNPPVPPNAGPSANPANGAAPPVEDRIAEWGRKQVGRMVNDLDRWLETPTGKEWATYLKTLAQRYEASSRTTAAIRDQAGRLSRYLPRVSDYLPRTALPTPTTPHLPRLPAIGPLALPTSFGPGSLAVSGGGALWVIALLALAALLWYGRNVPFGLARSGPPGWRLGPWPVRPADVATRGDLVQAFEHLALLRLGPDARTHHHLELAARLGGQPDLDPDRRRDSALALARLYETSRYAPDDTPLAPEELLLARRDLCYLAGESAA